MLKYFTKCEDELNNTLIDEMLRFSNCDLNDSLNDKSKRVHFTPNFSDFLNVVDNISLTSMDSDLSIDLKNELGVCLDRLKADANAVLALTTNLNQETGNKEVDKEDDQINSLNSQLKNEIQLRNELNEQLNETKDYVKNLENERTCLENEVEQLLAKQKVLENDLSKYKERISDLIECGQKEIVSEGFGENRSSYRRSLSMFYFRNSTDSLILPEASKKSQNFLKARGIFVLYCTSFVH